MNTEPSAGGTLNTLLDDLEEALARRIGDIAAHRLVGTARQVAALGRDAGGRLLEGVIEYALEERRLLVARVELGTLRTESEKLAEKIEQLEKRLERLAGGR